MHLGILDQGEGVLIVFDEPPVDKTYETALETIQNMSKVVELALQQSQEIVIGKCMLCFVHNIDTSQSDMHYIEKGLISALYFVQVGHWTLQLRAWPVWGTLGDSEEGEGDVMQTSRQKKV